VSDPQGERKLAAILSADVVGYSRLMADDESATIRTLQDYREGIAMLVRQHRGRVVDFPGDNILAEFPTALDAVRCALEIQAVLRARNASLPGERRMEFRIGVHMGDVVVDGDRIYGEGVNIAARLEGLAEAGGVCISATVHEQVRNKLEVGFADLGDQTVKNIPEQVHVYRVQPRDAVGAARASASSPARPRRRLRAAVVSLAILTLLVAVGLWASWPRPVGLVLDLAGVSELPANPPLPEKPSVVVLPFANMSGDEGEDYFADGLTEEVTANLAGTPLLFVISRNSAFSYKGKPVKVEEVGRELGVRYVVEGSVRKAGDRVRITAQLIDAGAGVQIWSQHYDRDVADIFAVQSEISEAILAAVGVEVRDAELARIRRRPTQDLSAYEAFMKGFSSMIRYRRADLVEARRFFEQAMALDPDYADPVSLLGSTYNIEYAQGWSFDPTLLERAEELAERALELDPSFPGGHMVLAGVYISRGRPDRVVAHARKAMELAPSFSPPRAFLAIGLAQQGRPLLALQSLGDAIRLDPRTSDSAVLWMIRAGLLREVGRDDEALELWRRARDANPDLIVPRLELIDHAVRSGRLDEARILADEIARASPEMTAERATELAGRFRQQDREQIAALGGSLRKAGLR
jgi:TolB-like protein/class 3 adenylate cyclase/Tfp pilus assembly protein PilF